ncbi:Metallo-dependent phosphatase-like protein [Crucibulum laeve]|uniref:Metallo-dependent phosphatase-like protein n=1 Tax=Crucibulum laeve TaxID=68775 RepID=A0A5C3MJI8_9AGAR|nr:Metallo-dependent phosphatase-like protein [Crucibulum laeve]
MAVFARGRRLVNNLRALWVLLILWYELGIFIYSVDRGCSWPDASFYSQNSPSANTDVQPYHILLVADPQILDHRSYPHRWAILTYLSRVFTDLNLLKNWKSALRTNPDAIIFLGDMMDGARFPMSDAEYERYYARFRRIFKVDSEIPQFFIPGNHDTGLAVNAPFTPHARSRYVSHFGEPNNAITVANHTLLLLDAPDIVEEDQRRVGAKATYKDWDAITGGTLDFVNDFMEQRDSLSIHEGRGDPVILFTHIPLHRPDGANCGPLRERGTIRHGIGPGYQNTLGKETSQFLLRALRPSLVFSGDDHDYCEYNHKLDLGQDRPIELIREVSVKSLSLAMGIRRPGFQLLSLAPVELSHNRGAGASHKDIPCALPDQLGIYIRAYLPFIFLSIIVLCGSNVLHHQRTRSRHKFRPVPQPARISTRRLHIRLELDIEEPYMEGEHDAGDPSRETFTKSTQARIGLWRATELLALAVGSICPCFNNVRRPGNPTLLISCWRDIRDVAAFPLVVFVVITWWTMIH